MRRVKQLDFVVCGTQILLNLVVVNSKPSLGYCFVELVLSIFLKDMVLSICSADSTGVHNSLKKVTQFLNSHV